MNPPTRSQILHAKNLRTAAVASFDPDHRKVVPASRFSVTGYNRMEIVQTSDGLKYLYIMRHSSTEMWRALIFN